MRFGAHTFVWEGEWTTEAARRAIRGVSKAGLDLIEVPLLRPDEFNAQETAEMLEEYNLQATFSLGLPVDASFPDNPVKAENFLKKAIDKVHASGSQTLTGVLYGTLGELPGRRPTEDDYSIIADTLKKVAQYAAQYDIKLGLEPVNRYETYLINTTQQAIDLINKIGEPNLCVHLDTYHANIEEISQRDAILTAGDRMSYVHLSESHRGTPGTGTVNWDDVFSGLKEICFSGDLVMESFVKLNPDIARATCMWRDIVKDPDALVRNGLQFLRSKATEYGLH